MEKFEIDKKLFLNVILGIALFNVVIHTVNLFNSWLTIVVTAIRFSTGSFFSIALPLISFLIAVFAVIYLFRVFFTKKETSRKTFLLIMPILVAALFFIGLVSIISANIGTTTTPIILAAVLAIVMLIHLYRKEEETDSQTNFVDKKAKKEKSAEEKTEEV